MPNFRLSPGNALALVLSLSVGSGSCLFRKPPAPFTPPATQSRPSQAAQAQPLPPPPQIAGDPLASGPPLVPTDIPETPAPPPSRSTPRRGNPATPPPKVNTPPATTDATPPTPAPPKLGQIFTPEQMREHNRAIDESLDRVRKALVVLSRKNLNAEQSETVNRIVAFQKQAEQAREAQDLANAELLAKRADLLATDLLTRVP